MATHQDTVTWGLTLSAYIILVQRCEQTLRGAERAAAEQALNKLRILLGLGSDETLPASLVCDFCHAKVLISELDKHRCPTSRLS